MSPAAVGTPAVCSACGAVTGAGAKFCEACGTGVPELPAPPAGTPVAATPSAGAPVAAMPSISGPVPCAECGGDIDPDGYCGSCGAKAPLPRDHVVAQPQPWLGAVSDRGLRHPRNEDAMAVDAPDRSAGRAVIVVCDGVSSAQDSDLASQAAAQAACGVLAAWLARGLGADHGDEAGVAAAMAAAADAAVQAVTEITAPDHGTNPPSCTFVAAVVDGGRIAIGSVGDSRAYWLPDDGDARVLSTDDSWAAEQIAVGVPRAEAESGPMAHAITRWLGVDAPEHTPQVVAMDVDAPGWLLVCSDGLWNYCSPAPDLAALVHRFTEPVADEPLATASALVDWANDQGGHDNITVVLARLGSGPAPGPSIDPQTGSAT